MGERTDTAKSRQSYVTVACWIIQTVYFYSLHGLPCFNAELVLKNWIFIEPLDVGSAYHKVIHVYSHAIETKMRIFVAFMGKNIESAEGNI